MSETSDVMIHATPFERSGMSSEVAPALPPYTPSGGAPSPLREAVVEVDVAAPMGPLNHIWAGIGYDEINWTYTRSGKAALGTIGDFAETPYYVRTHYVFNSGSGLGVPHWGSGNVYHEDDGQPFYDFTIADRTYDAVLEAGHRPLVELAFTPRSLVPDEAFEDYPFGDSPTQYSAYEAGLWSYPPKDFGRWADLAAALVAHCVDRYGKEEVAQWPWEVWNEPNIYYWRGTAEQYHELYRLTVTAIRRVLPEARVGGPATTGDFGGDRFLRGFLEFCRETDAPVDFLSFHTKGGRFDPNRTYRPVGSPAPVRQSPSLAKMLREIRSYLSIISTFPEYRDLPILSDECDASVPAHYTMHDNPNFGYRNTEYYAAFQCKLMKKILDLNEGQHASLDLAMTWSFYFEGESYFSGTRALFTTDMVEKPVLNAYRLLARLGDTRLTANSSASWGVERLDEGDAGMPEEIDALATVDDHGVVRTLLWRHADDQYHVDDGVARVRLRFERLPWDGKAVLREWRIDGEHSNSHAVWRSMGSPSDPTPQQVAEMKARQGTELIAEQERTVQGDEALEVDVELSLPSVSLLEIAPAGA